MSLVKIIYTPPGILSQLSFLPGLLIEGQVMVTEKVVVLSVDRLCHRSVDELDELQACIADIMETEDVNIHPGWMIGIIMISTFVVNAVGIWFDRMAIRSRWN